MKEKCGEVEQARRVEEARRRAEKIARKAEQLGCLGRLRLPPRPGSGASFWWGVFAASLLSAYLAGLSTPQGVIRAWLTYNSRDIYADKCAMWMPDWLTRALRPPEDCSMCRNVTRVEKIENTTPQDFEQKFAYTGLPVVVKDGTRGWTAPQVFSYEFFKELYSGVEHSSRCQFFPYETDFDSLEEVFSMSHERANLLGKPWYVGWSNCDEKVARRLRAHYDRPYFLPLYSENKNTDWIFMGSPGYGAKMHVDNVNNPSWQAQLVGSKKWTIEPPPECYFQCQTLEVVVDPGEIIILDTNRWYHKTLIVSDGISITIGAEYD